MSWAEFRIRCRIRCFCFDPDADPIFKFLWIRMRFQSQYPGAKKRAQKGLQKLLLEEKLKDD